MANGTRSFEFIKELPRSFLATAKGAGPVSENVRSYYPLQKNMGEKCKSVPTFYIMIPATKC